MKWNSLLAAAAFCAIFINVHVGANPDVIRIQLLKSKKPQRRTFIIRCCSDNSRRCYGNTTATKKTSLDLKTAFSILGTTPAKGNPSKQQSLQPVDGTTLQSDITTASASADPADTPLADLSSLTTPETPLISSDGSVTTINLPPQQSPAATESSAPIILDGSATSTNLPTQQSPAAPGISAPSMTVSTATNLPTSGPATTQLPTISGAITTTRSGTTTTTVPPCLPFKCSVDATKLDATSGKVNPKAITNGVLKQACDRLYLFSSDTKKWADAASYCCSLGMQLLTIESWQRITCISDLMNSPDGSGIPAEYLTSLSDYRKENEFLWCTGNFTALGNLTWKSGEPSGKGFFGEEEDCTSVVISAGPVKNNVMNDVSCDSSIKYICETPVATTTKPPCLPFTCEKKSSLLDANDYINPSAVIDGQLRLACGRMYYFSNSEKNWQEAAAECCNRNMQLLSIEDAQEVLCLSSMLARSNYGGFQSGWWTAGSDEFHENYFVWCTASTTKNITSDFKFGSGEPNNMGGNENCIEMVVTGGTPPTNVYFNDRTCVNFKSKFICETYEPGCSMPKCPNATCQTEVAKVDSSKKWKTNADGTFRRACGKQYFITKLSKSRVDAETECCKYGLKLLSIDSYKQIECIAEMNDAEYKNNIDWYWTSGSNDGFGCDLTYGFCGINKLLYQNFSNWNPNEPSTPLSERCMEMKLDVNPQKIVFNDIVCTEGRYFICEGDVPECTPTCPDKSKCTNDSSLFNKKGGILETHTYGRWASGCGKSFLFSTNSLSWDKALEMCCKLGMELVSIEDDAKMKCIFEINNNNSLLKYTSEFWTSGTQLDCNFRYKFCSSGASILRNDTKWLAGEPNNIDESQWCVASRFAPGSTLLKDQNYLFDAGCNTGYRYICEMPAKPCTSVSCYDYNCTTEPAKVSQVTAMSGPDGQFQTFCGRKYFFHKDSKNYKDAYYECCKYGMELFSVENNTERECIQKGFLSSGWGSDTWVWTSGTSNGAGCVPSFGWCPSGTLVGPSTFWLPNEPTSPFVENCIAFINSNDLSKAGFIDLTCTDQKRFLCEEKS
ncbi:uncharacterized protein LOC132200308 [Neocloeon triangulifer]|uniref:uncharacterized protein LOC132200308 n=1 Tax=Neocloeon triangulifer TaxID=2078957 RepID=UPI00286F41B8|nr:uncharacterized protein LOC132200308 [Neocloeon triangulifer]